MRIKICPAMNIEEKACNLWKKE